MSHTPIKYPSTNQFRQVIHNVMNTLSFGGVDENGNTKRKLLSPEETTLTYVGTVKLHGTNASIVFYSEDDFVIQSKERIITPENDNANFAKWCLSRNINDLLNQVKWVCEQHEVNFEFPVEIAGEFAGRGIQKGVAIAETLPFLAIFGVAVGRKKSGMNWLPVTYTVGMGLPQDRIYSIFDFGCWYLDIPFHEPEAVQNGLASLTKSVEDNCPAGKFFNVKDNTVGEGIVWKPVNEDLASDSGTWFKIKGEKHSVSKVKTLAQVNPEKLKSIQDFVEYAVTENRMQQGLSEVGLDQSKVREFLSWISRDIFKEESDVLGANDLIMKDVAKLVSNKARAWYLNKLNNF